MLVEKVPATLEVRAAALFLPDHHGRLAFAGGAGNPALVVPDHKVLGDVQSVALFQSASPAPVFHHFPWARLAIPLRVNDMTTGLLLLGAKPSDDPFDFQEVAFVGQVADAAAIAGENVRLFEALQEMAEDRLRVRSAERMQLAHRLHDEPLQRTYMLAQSLEKVSAALSDDHQLANLLSAQREEVRTLARELRDITAGLRPPILSQGLLLTLRQVVRTFQANNPGIIVELVLASDDEPEISEQALDAAYHVVLEALSNVGRHSGAQRARVTLETMLDTIRICVSDDGRGTPLSSSSLPELVRDRHFGIAGMHEWADMAGGRLRMLAVSPSGTSIELHIPRTNGQPN